MATIHAPWRHETDPSAFHFGAVVDAMGNSICTPHGYDKLDLGPLLAAAPDMLAALKATLTKLEAIGWRSELPVEVASIRAAIAKAEGR